MKILIAIPVYKAVPADIELRSLRQCLSVLGTGAYDFCLFGPPTLDLSAYDRVFAEYGQPYTVQHFDAGYFASQPDYNRLMLVRDFYLRFREWEYMLLYQLDAWVFRDELAAWCSKGYDYVGAPFFSPTGKLWWHDTGNGGFSLRKIESFIRLFDHRGRVLTLRGLWHFHRYRGPRHKLSLIWKGMFGKDNYLENFLDGRRTNEDLFYSTLNHKRGAKWRIPGTREAMYFAFEVKPATLYALSGRLPFGCHAFLKYDYDTFWKQFIP